MLHIDTVLLLYHDKTIRRQLLSLALTHIQTDLTALRNAIDNGDKNAALHHTHRAKGTASFLGADKQMLRQFDQLTHALCPLERRADPVGSVGGFAQADRVRCPGDTFRTDLASSPEDSPQTDLTGSFEGSPQTDRAGSSDTSARPTSRRGQSSGSARCDVAMPVNIELAFKAVAAILQELETSLQVLIQEQKES